MWSRTNRLCVYVYCLSVLSCQSLSMLSCIRSFFLCYRAHVVSICVFIHMQCLSVLSCTCSVYLCYRAHVYCICFFVYMEFLSVLLCIRSFYLCYSSYVVSICVIVHMQLLHLRYSLPQFFSSFADIDWQSEHWTKFELIKQKNLHICEKTHL